MVLWKRWWNLQDFVLHATIQWGTIVDNARGGYTIQIGFYSLSCHRLNHNPDWGVFLITNSFWQGLGQYFVQDCTDVFDLWSELYTWSMFVKNCHWIIDSSFIYSIIWMFYHLHCHIFITIHSQKIEVSYKEVGPIISPI